MNTTELDTETVVITRKRTDVLKSQNDRPTREPVEHPDRIPPEQRPHPVTHGERKTRRDGPA
jgi:hypothetical protein